MQNSKEGILSTEKLLLFVKTNNNKAAVVRNKNNKIRTCIDEKYIISLETIYTFTEM